MQVPRIRKNGTLNFFPNVPYSQSSSDGRHAVSSSGEVDFDVLPSQVSGALDVHAELGLVVGEDVKESVLLDVEGPLYNGGGHRSSGGCELLEFPVDLQEVTKLDEVPLVDLPSYHLLWIAGVQTDWIAGYRIPSYRIVGHRIVGYRITSHRESVHPIVSIVGIDLGGRDGSGDEAEEDQPV